MDFYNSLLIIGIVLVTVTFCLQYVDGQISVNKSLLAQTGGQSKHTTKNATKYTKILPNYQSMFGMMMEDGQQLMKDKEVVKTVEQATVAFNQHFDTSVMMRAIEHLQEAFQSDKVQSAINEVTKFVNNSEAKQKLIQSAMTLYPKVINTRSAKLLRDIIQRQENQMVAVIRQVKKPLRTMAQEMVEDFRQGVKKAKINESKSVAALKTIQSNVSQTVQNFQDKCAGLVKTSGCPRYGGLPTNSADLENYSTKNVGSMYQGWV